MGSTAFGMRIGDVLTWVTIVLTALFLVVSVFTTMVFRTPAGEVRAPIFAPEPGPIEKTAGVRMACPTPGASIYFTLDGSEPDNESTPYEGKPVQVDPGRTLKARAYRAGWKPSPVATGLYDKAESGATAPADEGDWPEELPEGD